MAQDKKKRTPRSPAPDGCFTKIVFFLSWAKHAVLLNKIDFCVRNCATVVTFVVHSSILQSKTACLAKSKKKHHPRLAGWRRLAGGGARLAAWRRRLAGWRETGWLATGWWAGARWWMRISGWLAAAAWLAGWLCRRRCGFSSWLQSALLLPRVAVSYLI